ncbi:MAG: NUDIX hydrolase [Actinomycetota bacterium]
MDEVIRASGAIVLGPTGVEPARIAVIHRPAYDDWTFPKGKALPGEADEEAALREVEEETGFTCRLGRPLGTVSYRDRHGRTKVVRYWLMRTLGGGFSPTDEVDELRWLPPAEAAGLLTYEHDRMLLTKLNSQRRLANPFPRAIA